MKGEFIRFLMVGGARTVLTYGIYLVLLYFINPYWAYIASFVASVYPSYLLNLKYTFRAGHSSEKLVSYPLVFAAQMFFGLAALHISLQAGVSDKLAPVFAIMVGIPVGFFMARWVIGEGKENRNPVLFLAVSTFTVSIAAVYGALLNGDLFPHGLLFNADNAASYLIWKDIFFQGGSISDWNLERVSANLFLTGYVLAFSLFSVTGGNYIFSMHLYGVVTAILSAVGWMLVSDFLFGRTIVRRSLVFILSALTCICLAYGAWPLLGLMVIPLHHFLTWALLPFCLLVFLAAARSGNTVKRSGLSVLLVALCSAVIYSDPVLIVWLVVPALAAGLVCVFLFRAKNYILPLAALAVGVFSMKFWEKVVLDHNNPAKNYGGFGSPDRIAASLREFIEWGVEAVLRHPFLFVIWLIFFFLLFRSVFKSLFCDGEKKPEILFVRLLLLSSPFAAVGASILTGNWRADNFVLDIPVLTAYLIPLMFVPIFIGWAFISETPALFRYSFKRFSLSALSLALVFVAAASVSGILNLKDNSFKFVSYYQPFDRCFDENARHFGLKRGIATYWWTKSTMASSKTGVTIAQVVVYPQKNRPERIFANKWGISNRFFKGPFDFVIANEWKYRTDQDFCMGRGFDECPINTSTSDPIGSYMLSVEDALLHFKRQPSAVFECEGAKVLVYKPPL